MGESCQKSDLLYILMKREAGVALGGLPPGRGKIGKGSPFPRKAAFLTGGFSLVRIAAALGETEEIQGVLDGQIPEAPLVTVALLDEPVAI